MRRGKFLKITDPVEQRNPAGFWGAGQAARLFLNLHSRLGLRNMRLGQTSTTQQAIL